MPELSAVLEYGSFGLVAYMVITQFRQQNALQQQTQRILAELTLQVARVNNASPDEVRESQKLLAQKGNHP